MPAESSILSPAEYEPGQELVLAGESLPEAADRLAVATGIEATPQWDRIKRLLNKLNLHNPDTYDHSLRVGIYAYEISMHENYDDPAFAFRSGCAHDVGKYGIDNTLLNMTERYTQSNREDMYRHTLFGYEALVRDPGRPEAGDPEVALVAGLHHKYPSLKAIEKGKESYGIDLEEVMPQLEDTEEGTEDKVIAMAKLIMLIDAFDATTTRTDLGNHYATDEERKQELIEDFPGQKDRIEWLFAHQIKETS
jgi:hypothetical protein